MLRNAASLRLVAVFVWAQGLQSDDAHDCDDAFPVEADHAPVESRQTMIAKLLITKLMFEETRTWVSVC